MSRGSYALNHEQKVFIIVQWAVYNRAPVIVKDFMHEYGLDYDDKELRKLVTRSVERMNFSTVVNRESVASVYVELFNRARAEYEEHVFTEPLFSKFGRVRAKVERHEALERVKMARGQEHKGFPGAEEGIHVIDYKGKDADVKVVKIDRDLLREQSELEKEIAEELGQASKKYQISELSDDDLLRALIASNKD